MRRLIIYLFVSVFNSNNQQKERYMLELNPAQVVPLFGKINHESIGKTLERVMTLWHAKPLENVFLVINSGGGSVDAGFMFIDLIQAADIKLVTIGTGHVGSMAIPVFCAGHRRLITSHTDFFFHELGHTYEKEQRVSLTDINVKGKNMAISQTWWAEFVAKRTDHRLTKEIVLDLMKAETWMFPEDIVKYGLAHEIV